MYDKYTGFPGTQKASDRLPARNVAGRSYKSKQSSADRERYEDARHSSEYYENTGRIEMRGGNGSSSGRRGGNSRKKKLRNRRIVVTACTIALLALITVAIIVIAKSCQEPVAVDEVTDVFRSGVYINGSDVSGQTIEQVRPSLQANEQYAINNIAITLQGDGFSSIISGTDMAATSNLEEVLKQALSGNSGQVYYTTIDLDRDALAQRIDEINQTLTSPPTDASFTVTIADGTGKPEFSYQEGKPGYGIDVDAAAELVHEAFTSGKYQTTITPPLTTVEPSITVEDIKAHTALIGSATTTYDFKGTGEDTEEQRNILIPNRAFNVEKAANEINGAVVKPGSTFSFNKVVGDRNEKNGWREANGIFGGDKYTYQYGGGVCQVSTTLFNAILDCYPYVTFNRQAHSIPSTYVDKGLDATVDTGHIDFTFKNTSQYPMYVFAYESTNRKYSKRKRDLTVVIYGEALPENVEYVPHTEVKEETLPGEPEITNDKKLYIGEEIVTAEARSRFVIDVYIDRIVNGELQESIYMYTDTYEGNPLRKKIGTMPTPTPLPIDTPQPTAAPKPTPDAETEEAP